METSVLGWQLVCNDKLSPARKIRTCLPLLLPVDKSVVQPAFEEAFRLMPACVYSAVRMTPNPVIIGSFLGGGGAFEVNVPSSALCLVSLSLLGSCLWPTL